MDNLSREHVEQLQSLVAHPGWLLFREFARQQWGPAGYGRRLKLALTSAAMAKTELTAAITAVDVAQNEINALLSWPTDQIHRLAPSPSRSTEPSLQRGGA